MRPFDRQLQDEIDRIREQNRALLLEQQRLSAQIQSLAGASSIATDDSRIPAMVNYVNNGELVFDIGAYDGVTAGGASDYAARWYAPASDSVAGFTEHTTTVISSDGLKNDNTLASCWKKASGYAVLGGKKTLAQPLVKNLASPGTQLYVRFQIRREPSITLTADWKLRVSIWDDTSGQRKLVEAAPFDLNATPNSSTGTFTRKYLLRVTTPATSFYSDVLTPVQVVNQVSVSAIDTAHYVDVGWQAFNEAIRYQLYRFDSEFSEWRLIADITNGATSFRDAGGRSGLTITPPSSNIGLKAEAIVSGFGGSVGETFADLVVAIRVPSNYNYSATTGKQWLRIDIVDSSYGDGVDNHYVTLPDRALAIDRIALGYTNGRWAYSAKDLTTDAAIVSTTPVPVDISGGGEGNPTEGSGGIFQRYDY